MIRVYHIADIDTIDNTLGGNCPLYFGLGVLLLTVYRLAEDVCGHDVRRSWRHDFDCYHRAMVPYCIGRHLGWVFIRGHFL